MAGTLTISTLSDGTNSTSATNCIQGSAKAWVNFTGSTGTVNRSYNVSSVTRNSTGDYTLNFTSAMPNATYAVSGSCQYQTGVTFQGYIVLQTNYLTPTTSQVRIGCSNGGGYFDPTVVTVAISSS